MKLLIVESPAKAKTISKYLDNKYTVKSSVGHIRDIPKSNKDAIDIENGFVPKYVVLPEKEKVVAELSSLCNKAEEVVLATDPDREGEAIAWHVAQICNLGNTKKKKSNIKRIVFNEITKPAVQYAIEHPRDIDENLRKAQEARRVLDRLFGYDLSGLIWQKVRYGLSAGRVQSPALRILMEREREVRAFIPETYWVIEAQTETPQKDVLLLSCSEEPREEKEVARILEIGKKGVWKIGTVKETEAKRSPRPPFITSTIQQTASTRLGFPPSRTMRIAQRLYEAGHITYMRTDSTSISSVAQREILSTIEQKFGKEYVSARTFKTKSKGAQEAHEAIRPTNSNMERAGSTDEQKKLYTLIWKRAISSQMSDAKLLKTKIYVSVNEEEIPNFTAIGSRTLFDGWLACDNRARGEDTELPKVSEGETLTLKDITSEEKQTEPPHRYSEAGLVKELEKRGIGRPSTYASTIKTLVDRKYVDQENRTLFPTELGEVVNDFVEKNFTQYISDSFTADMENELDEIARGEREYDKTLSEFYSPFSKDIALKKKDVGKITDLGPAPKGTICPICDATMVIKLGRGGKFLSCSKFPECMGARTIDGEEIKPPKETGDDCPECKGKLIERDGKFGRFIGCSKYPKCKYIKQDENTKNNQPTTGVGCPECKKGELAERKGKFGIFYGCNNYPNCKFTLKSKPTGKTCTECGALEMTGTKTIPDRCSSKTCPMHNPHKLEK
jgi:DNA topoisomerase I